MRIGSAPGDSGAAWGRRAALALLFTVLTGACAEPRGPSRDPNVLFLVVDALRPDHLGYAGYARDVSPCLDELAGRSAVFGSARSVANFTRASVPSLFTGVLPSAHGVFDRTDRLHDGFETLAEILAERGYATAAFAPNPSLDRRHNFGQGFDLWDDRILREEDPYDWRSFETASRIQDAALRFLAGHPERPFFLYLHYRDVHGPYLPPPRYKEMFWRDDDRDRSSLTRLSSAQLAAIPEYMRLAEAPPYLEYYVSQYDAEIRYTDDRICELLGVLDSTGRLADTIVVVTADHGESFLEHGDWNHGNELYEEELQVPLLLRVPGESHPDLPIETTVTGLDLMPTVLDLVGAAAPSYLEGRSLVPLLRGERWPERAAISEGKKRIRVAVFKGGWKLLRLGESGEWRVFDLVRDPGERNDLSGVGGGNDRARAMVKDWRRAQIRNEEIRRRFPAEGVDFDEALDAELRALGYLR